MAEPEAKRARPAALEARISTLAQPTLGEIIALTVAIDGTVFVATRSALYAISLAGVLTLFAGSEDETGYNDGQGSKARFNQPYGLAVASDGSLLVADTLNSRLRRVTLHGTVSTVAGGGGVGFASKGGFTDGVGTAARFNWPYGIVVDAHGIIYVSDYSNHCIRKVTPADWTVSTLCGKNEVGFADGAAAVARFSCPRGLALDMDGNLIVADSDNHCIRKVAPSDGRVSTVAGSRAGGYAGLGCADSEAAAARFNEPSAVAVDGNNAILVADRNNHRLRMISGDGAMVTTLAGSSLAGQVNGEGAVARFNQPWAMVLDERGRLLLAELGNEGCLRVAEASLAPRLAVEPLKNPLTSVVEDYAKMLTDTALADVIFAVDGQRFLAHRCVLKARSPYFKALFASGQGMREEGSREAGGHIVLEDMSAPEFERLLEYLYGNKLPEGEEWKAGPGPGEMAVVADRFQASGLYAHCVVHFVGGFKVGNVMARLVQVRDSGLAELEEAAMEYLKANALTFQVLYVFVDTIFMCLSQFCCVSLSTQVLLQFGLHNTLHKEQLCIL